MILDRNPLKVESKAIKSIAVEETIKEGRTIFRKSLSVAATVEDPGAAVAATGCDCRVRPSLVPTFRPMGQADRDSLSRLAAAAASSEGSGQ